MQECELYVIIVAGSIGKMGVCDACATECDGTCASKRQELGAVIGPVGDDQLIALLLGAGGDVNRYSPPIILPSLSFFPLVI